MTEGIEGSLAVLMSVHFSFIDHISELYVLELGLSSNFTQKP